MINTITNNNYTVPDFTLRHKGPLTNLLLTKHITTFHETIRFVQYLPYRRTSDKTNLALVVKENCGTCSSKHAFLAQLAIEQDRTDIQLVLAMYKMDNFNTVGIGSVLENSQLPYIPEAHCYLKYKNTRLDITLPTSDISTLEADIIEEKPITPPQIGAYKTQYHKMFLGRWRMLNRKASRYGLSELWKLREDCIELLSK